VVRGDYIEPGNMDSAVQCLVADNHGSLSIEVEGAETVENGTARCSFSAMQFQCDGSEGVQQKKAAERLYDGEYQGEGTGR